MPVVHVMHDIQAAELVRSNPRLRYVAETHARGYGEHHLVPLACSWPLEGETVVMKRSFDSFYKTGLDAQLRKRGVRRILVCGLLTGMCVLSTTLSAFARGYEVTLLRDATNDDDARRYRVVRCVYPEVSRVSDVRSALREGSTPERARQLLNRHAPSVHADPAERAPPPVGGVLLVLNPTSLYMTPEQRAQLEELGERYRAGGGRVYRVHTDTSASGGSSAAFQRLFGRPLQLQTRARAAAGDGDDDVAVNVASSAVFDGPQRTGLHHVLRKAGVGQVAIAGALGGLQVLQALLDAFNRQLWVVIVTDRLFDTHADRRLVTIESYDGQLCTGLTSRELLKAI